MRFVHTADWHLGRLFHGISLTDDQAYVLDQLVDVVREARPDLLIVAGDIYDRAVPPPDAVALLDDVLERVVRDLGVSVVMIAGNHDSAERVGFCSGLLSERGLHVAGRLEERVSPVVVEDRHGPVHVYPVPYAEPAVARERTGDDSVRDHETALAAVLEPVRAGLSRERRSILVTHAFVAGGVESESERPLSIGGASTVPAACLAGFDYVALGHLHRRQRIRGPDGAAIEYSGSPLKYSFSESDHIKSITVVDMDRDGSCDVERVPLRARHDVRCIEGRFEDLLGAPAGGVDREDYLLVTLLDREPVFDAIGRLREVYPNVLQFERPCLRESGVEEVEVSRDDRGRRSEAGLFSSFFSQVTGEELSRRQEEAFRSVASSLDDPERREESS